MSKFIKFKALIQIETPNENAQLFKDLAITMESKNDIANEVDVIVNTSDISHVFELPDNKAIVILKSDKPNLISTEYTHIATKLSKLQL